MNCREAKSLFSARIDGELSGLESAALESHLSVCPPCAEETRSLASTVLLLRTMPEETPDPMFIGRVLDRVRGFEAEQASAARAALRSRQGRRPWWSRISEHFLPSPVPAGLALAVGAFAGFILIQSNAWQAGRPGESDPGSAVARNETPHMVPSSLGGAPASPFEDLVTQPGDRALVTQVSSVARSDSGPAIAGGAVGSPVEVLVPDWWNVNAPDPQVQTVGTQNGGSDVVVF